MMFLGYCFGQFSGPFLFKPSEAPTYPTAFRGFYCAVSFMILVELTLLYVLVFPFCFDEITSRKFIMPAYGAHKLIQYQYLDLLRKPQA